MVRLAVLLASLALFFPAAAPAISGHRSDRIAARVLGVARAGHAVKIHRLPGVLGRRAVISEPGPGHLGGRTRVVRTGDRTTLVTPLSRARIGRRVRLYWEDVEPGALFPHPSRLLLLDAKRGRVVRDATMAWWPLVNGRAFRPPARRSRRAPAPARTAATPGAANSRIIEIGDFGEPETRNNFQAWARFAIEATGQPVIGVDDAVGLRAALRDAYTDGARDVVIYLNGHQFTPNFGLDFSGRFQDWVNRVWNGTPPGPYVSLGSSAGAAGHTWKQSALPASDLVAAIDSAKRVYADLKVSVVVEACGAGNFAPELLGVADRYIASSSATKDSLAPRPGGSAASAFSGVAIAAIGKVLAGAPLVDLSTALAEAEGAIVAQTPDAAEAQGAFWKQEPVVDRQVSGQIITPTTCTAENAWRQIGDPARCDPPTGMIAVLLRVEFNGLQGVGTVDVSPAGETVTGPTERDLYFYAAPGAAIKVTATHGEGHYFLGWQVNNGGSCAPPYGVDEGDPRGGSPGICTITVEDEFHDRRFNQDIRAFFETCPPPGTTVAHDAAKDCPGTIEAPS
jgi:hypothetical protein